MEDRTYSFTGEDGETLTLTLNRDRRLKKSARWARQPDGTYLLRIPYHTRHVHLNRILKDVQRQIVAARRKQNRRAAGRNDEDLMARAQQINRTYFNGVIRFEAIRWVGNMNTRLGSCTNGGPTDGHIRLSDKIQGWPDWVVDYIIAHELAHRAHPNHSADFWIYLETHYPLTERARGFIQGVGFSLGMSFDEDE